MNQKQSLIIELENENCNALHLANIYADLIFYRHGRRCYGFRFGPTNQAGKLYVHYQDIEVQRIQAARFNLMDYNTPLDNCDDLVKIKVPSADELRKAHDWQNKSLPSGASPEAKKWLDAANGKIKCSETSVELKGTETVVPILCSMVRT